MFRGFASPRHDLRTTHEEADLILVQRCYKSLETDGYKAVRIISDDTDVFALACYHYPERGDDITVYMEPTKKGRSVANIGESVRKHPEIMPFIIQAHAVSGCDSVCHLQGIGKATVVKVMKKKCLIHLGNLDSTMEDVITEATDFIGELLQYLIWKRHVGKKVISNTFLLSFSLTVQDQKLEIREAFIPGG